MPIQRKRRLFLSGLLVSVLHVSGCHSLIDKHITYATVAPEHFPVLTSVGYAPISQQQGATHEVRMVQAMQASKLLAYQELAEQLHGMRIMGEADVQQMIVGQQLTQSHIQGVVQGAKVVRSYPVGEDTYATELSLDTKRLADLRVLHAQPKRIKDIKYY